MPWRCMGESMYRFTLCWRWVPRLLCPRETAPRTPWTGSWVDPKAGRDYVQNRKFLTLLGLELRFRDAAMPAFRSWTFLNLCPTEVCYIPKICLELNYSIFIQSKMCLFCNLQVINNVCASCPQPTWSIPFSNFTLGPLEVLLSEGGGGGWEPFDLCWRLSWLSCFKVISSRALWSSSHRDSSESILKQRL
jgi:hypothetical protein